MKPEGRGPAHDRTPKNVKQGPFLLLFRKINLWKNSPRGSRVEAGGSAGRLQPARTVRLTAAHGLCV